MSEPTSRSKRKSFWIMLFTVLAFCAIPVFIAMVPQENRTAWRLMSEGYQVTHNFDNSLWIYPRSINCNSKTVVSNEVLEQFPKLRHVNSVGFTGTDFSDLDLKPLTQMPNLSGLLFYNCSHLQTKELLKLKNCSKLNHLNITRIPITAEEVESWEKLPLQSMSLDSCDLTDNEMEKIANYANLYALNVTNNPDITDAALEHLLELKSLQMLNLRSTSVTEKGIEEFRKKHTPTQD